MVWEPQEFYQNAAKRRCFFFFLSWYARWKDVFFPGDFGSKSLTGSIGFMKFGFGWEFLGFFQGKIHQKWMKLTASLPLTNWWLEDQISLLGRPNSQTLNVWYIYICLPTFTPNLWGPYDHFRCSHRVVGPCLLTGRGPPCNRWKLSQKSFQQNWVRNVRILMGSHELSSFHQVDLHEMGPCTEGLS